MGTTKCVDGLERSLRGGEGGTGEYEPRAGMIGLRLLCIWGNAFHGSREVNLCVSVGVPSHSDVATDASPCSRLERWVARSWLIINLIHCEGPVG